MAMEEDPAPQGEPVDGPSEPGEELDPRELLEDLRENERRWATEGDSEPLWEQEHQLLIGLQRAGDVGTLMKRARRAKRAAKRGAPVDLAQAALALWVLERFDESEAVLRAAIVGLPRNRYPWSLLLRHLSWERHPGEAMEFIRSSLGTVPWKGYAYVQLGTLSVDAASRSFKAERWDYADKFLGEARAYLEAALAQSDCTEEMRGTSRRLLYLVETMERRVQKAKATVMEPLPEEAVTPVYSPECMERDMREVAEASGVSLEGEPDHELDLEELERTSLQEMPDGPEEKRYTVLEVTPGEGKGLIRRRKRED